ncbi:NAD(P)H-quinone oxidoreductase subunit H [Planctomycetes bacterium Pan216]|uniref:NADH-quinone oxidoreductase subunit D n=1 Tax=Kolteria novifilia TaxID=2527975 RepID=A0A518B4P9_9BACT|nr:NAD(P)H-quinone oxidoreductase subunit H [Planctomycetes bacterium Pan216]
MSYTIEDPADVEFDVRTDELLINMGPQHPSTHGVLRLVLRTDGEVVIDAVPHIGYLHRCAEKIGENLSTIEYIPYTDRMDYLSGMNMNLGFAVAAEKLMGTEIPPKAQYLRIIIAEMNRIASHLVGMGTYGLDLGTFSPFLYAFREREKILDLFEEVCGARLTYSYITVGGAHDDLPDGWLDKCLAFLDYFEPRIEEYHTLLTRNHIFIKRTANIGVISPEMAKSYGCSGPVLRGSGVNDDLRVSRPYLPYDEFKWEVEVAPFDDAPEETVVGDCWNRYYVRMREVVQSVSLVRQAAKAYVTAEGSHRADLPRALKVPVGEVYVETECPRGAMGFHVVGQDDPKPLRCRAKSSSFCNLSVTGALAPGVLIADLSAIVGSLDIVMGEIDR